MKNDGKFKEPYPVERTNIDFVKHEKNGVTTQILSQASNTLIENNALNATDTESEINTQEVEFDESEILTSSTELSTSDPMVSSIKHNLIFL